MTTVKTFGKSAGTFSVEVMGVGLVIEKLRRTGHKIEAGADLGVIKAGTFVAEQLTESIAGNKAETKSVDTGHFIKDVKFDRMGKAQGKIHTPNTPYAKFLEFGTSKIQARHHFRNTAKRTKGDVKKIIEQETGFGKKGLIRKDVVSKGESFKSFVSA